LLNAFGERFLSSLKNIPASVAGVCALRVGLVAKGDLSAPDRPYFSTPITRSSGLPSLARKLIGSQVRQWILLNAFGERFLSSLKNTSASVAWVSAL
jgi:hypothetical protein